MHPWLVSYLLTNLIFPTSKNIFEWPCKTKASKQETLSCSTASLFTVYTSYTQLSDLHDFLIGDLHESIQEIH